MRACAHLAAGRFTSSRIIDLAHLRRVRRKALCDRELYPGVQRTALAAAINPGMLAARRSTVGGMSHPPLLTEEEESSRHEHRVSAADDNDRATRRQRASTASSTRMRFPVALFDHGNYEGRSAEPSAPRQKEQKHRGRMKRPSR